MPKVKRTSKGRKRTAKAAPRRRTPKRDRDVIVSPIVDVGEGPPSALAAWRMRLRKRIPRKWRELFSLIPNYDPIGTAAEGDYFDVEAAEHAVGFYPACLRHVEGPIAGEAYELAPWEQAIVGCLFGWMREDKLRRYRQAFIYVPKKNDKTTLSSGLVLYGLTQDGEQSPKIFSAASSRDQAAIVFGTVAGMVKQNPTLGSFKGLRLYGDKGGSQQRSITNPANMGVYRPLAADADTADGQNVYMAIVDELHRHKDGEMTDILIRGTSARLQPMVVIITTADYDRESACNQKYAEACRVRDNGGDPAKPGYNPSFLPVIYEASTADDWTDPAVWAKANPNLGRSKPIAYMHEACENAKHDPHARAKFLRLDLNIRTQQVESLIDMVAWDKCPRSIDADALRKACKRGERIAFGAFDLGHRDDLAAISLAIPPEGFEEDADLMDTGVWEFLWWFFCPKETIRKREMSDVPYHLWQQAGFLIGTEGNDIDFAVVRKTIIQVNSDFNVSSWGYDPWSATQLSSELHNDHGLDVAGMRQGMITLSEPTKRFCSMVRTGRLNHGSNPLARWNAANAVGKTDANSNVMPVKDLSKDKIDGIVAAIMATGRAMAPRPKKSVYRKRGIRYL